MASLALEGAMGSCSESGAEGGLLGRSDRFVRAAEGPFVGAVGLLGAVGAPP
jgi:hypothetical protein